MLLANKKYVKTVTILFEDILKSFKYYESTAGRYQLFIVILICYMGHAAHDDANFAILRSQLFQFSAVKSRKQLSLSCPHSQLTTRFARDTFQFCVFFSESLGGRISQDYGKAS